MKNLKKLFLLILLTGFFVNQSVFAGNSCSRQNVQKKEISDTKIRKICSICLNVMFEEEDLISLHRLNVPHVFHEKCLKEWVNTKGVFGMESSEEIEYQLNSRDLKGRTPLHMAAKRRYKSQKIEDFLKNGADINAKDNYGRTPVHYFSANTTIKKQKESSVSDKELENLFRYLHCYGVDVNARDNDGLTPLHYAIKHGGEVRHLLVLLKNGADVTARDNDGRTPLDIAIAYSSYFSVKNFFGENDFIVNKFGIIIQELFDSYGPHWVSSIKNGCLAVVKILLEAGVQVNRIDIDFAEDEEIKKILQKAYERQQVSGCMDNLILQLEEENL